MSGSATPTADSHRSFGASYAGGLWTLYVLTVRQHLHGRRWLVMGALFLVPAALAALIRTTATDVPPRILEFVLAMMFIPQLLLPLTALLYASGIIQDEQEEQTLTYLLVRPLPKWAIYVAKLLATLTTTVALTWVFTALTYATIYVGADSGGESIVVRCAKAASIHSLAIVTYCCFFGLMSLMTKRTLVLGIVYTAVVEGLLANMPFSMRLITVIYYARLIAYRVLDFVVPMPHGGVENVTAEAWQLNVRDDPKLLEHPELSTCIIVLLGASFAFAVLAAGLCSRREFHVKTPEKA